jgi:hypothetical protein
MRNSGTAGDIRPKRHMAAEAICDSPILSSKYIGRCSFYSEWSILLVTGYLLEKNEMAMDAPITNGRMVMINNKEANDIERLEPNNSVS